CTLPYTAVHHVRRLDKATGYDQSRVDAQTSAAGGPSPSDPPRPRHIAKESHIANRWQCDFCAAKPKGQKGCCAQSSNMASQGTQPLKIPKDQVSSRNGLHCAGAHTPSARCHRTDTLEPAEMDCIALTHTHAFRPLSPQSLSQPCVAHYHEPVCAHTPDAPGREGRRHPPPAAHTRCRPQEVMSLAGPNRSVSRP